MSSQVIESTPFMTCSCK